ncbi:MAG: FAD:protein FMN transferase [Nitrospinae bacterium]|nr:FAD:protein FMN transferase [Nitrospinota bacterium]
MKFIRIARTCGVLLSLLSLLGCEKAEEAAVYKKSAFIMGTIVNITIVDSNEKDAAVKIEEAFDEIRRIEGLMMRMKPTSDATKINASAGEGPVKVNPETLQVIMDSLPATSLTSGKFDITIGPLTSLWDFENNGKREFVPSADEIQAARSLVGIKDLEIDSVSSSVFLKRKGMTLDLGGIAQGYAADQAVKLLKSKGIKSGIVDISGDILLFGHKPDGSVWRTGIQHPRKEKEILAVLELTDKAVVTAGDYEHYFIKDGVRYHHIIDPDTGYPAGECQSVTIVTDKTVYADSVDDGIFILGPEKGMELINSRNDMDGFIVAKDGKILVSERLKGKVEILGN